MKIQQLAILGICLAIVGCSGPSVPEVFTDSKALPKIYPDYIDVTIPINIAPLTFELDEEADDMIARYAFEGEEIVCQGKAQPGMDEWRALTEKAKGNAITVDVYACKADQWTHYKPFNIFVSPDSIDSYLSYRLIYPSFVSYEALTINQRCLENYEESVIFSNMLISTDENGQCINCHSVKNYNPDSLQFHARQHKGGTLMAFNGDIRKINLKTDSTLSAGVYPAWHPTHNYIAYSVNNTGQSFHTRNNEKIEVQDLYSDLILYDIDLNEVTTVENDTTEWECYPCWAPDGKTLYFVSAKFIVQDYSRRDREIIDRYQEFKYNLYKKSFDPTTKHFGPRELVFDAAATGQSVTLPRVSPDGRYLMVSIGDYGVFHIWHRSGDLLLIDLQNGNIRKPNEINSPDTESFHNWSSNGRWVLFSSRRLDGNFTRLYLAYFDKNGRGRKPFVIPQKIPDYYTQFYKSYNIPEFMKGPVTISPQQFAKRINGPTTSAVYHEKY